MKRQTSFVVGLLLVAAMSLPMAGVASAKTGPGSANQIIIKAQDANRGQIIIDSVTAAQDGWLVIYTDPCIRRCAMIGYTPVHRGLNTHFTADINSDQAQLFSTLWAVLHVDKGITGLLELPGPDEPVVQDGKPVMVAFGTHPAPPPGPPPAKKTTIQTIRQAASRLSNSQLVQVGHSRRADRHPAGGRDGRRRPLHVQLHRRTFHGHL